jgi:AcrR family transcriptional regulator
MRSARASRRRAHTGRARNEEVRQAILQSTLALLMSPEAGTVTIDAIAARAGVGKQTIYRWWSTKSALVIEALSDSARDRVPDIDSGDLRRDLEHFLTRTFRVVGSRPVTTALRAMMADALHDPQAADVLREYTARRRAALQAILARAAERGELSADADAAIAVEQTFGFLWYRLLLGHAPLTRKAAINITEGLLRQLGALSNPGDGSRASPGT